MHRDVTEEGRENFILLFDIFESILNGFDATLLKIEGLVDAFG
jgi:hypothetical protein